jgi:hypothetical protein
MNKTLDTRSFVTALCAVAALAIATAAAAQTHGSAQRFTASAVDLDTGTTTRVEVVINRWSTDAERDRLLTTLVDKGPDKLLDELQRTPKVGYIRTTNSIGWDLHFARHVALPEGGEQIIIATDRPIGFREAVNRPRSSDYRFTVIELKVNSEGDGDGRMSVATRITADKDKVITLENFTYRPVLLQVVRREEITH